MNAYYSNLLISQEKDPGSRMTRKGRSGINIPDPQHCKLTRCQLVGRFLEIIRLLFNNDEKCLP
jgi:hypothetical protein